MRGIKAIRQKGVWIRLLRFATLNPMTRTQALELLRLSEPFSQSELKQAYLNISKGIHADFMGNLNTAYELLKAELPVSPPPQEQPEPPGTTPKNPLLLKALSLATEKWCWHKFIQGDYGLPKTFWMFGVLWLVVVMITTTGLIEVIPPMLSENGKDLTGDFLSLVYSPFDLVYFLAIWRAASKYTGPKVWAVLAKTTVVLGWAQIIAGFYFAVKYYSSI